MPDGVPEVDDVDVALAAAKLAAVEIADRRSAELTHAQEGDAADAERELAWRRNDERVAAEQATERDDALSY